MNNNEIYTIVKKHIDQMDYYCLLTNGAPDNEFDIESLEISKQINCKMSVSEISNIIANVFNSRFDNHDDSSLFLSVAEKILHDLIINNQSLSNEYNYIKKPVWNSIKKALSIILGVSVCYFIVRVIWIIVDYKTHPELYLANSAPWYTPIIVASAFWGTIISLEIIVLLFARYKATTGPIIGVIERKD